MQPSYLWLVPAALLWAAFGSVVHLSELSGVEGAPPWQLRFTARWVLGAALLGILSGGWLISRLRRPMSLPSRIGSECG